MPTKKTPDPKATAPIFKNASISVPVPNNEPEEVAAATARTLARPEVTSAAVIENWQKDTHDVNAVVAELARQVAAVNDGDLKRAEGMLIAQAHALDVIFANLARRATNQEYLKQWEIYMRMAMKAQAQCRMTLETLAAIKNPPVVIARQANFANGPQQVNNSGTAPSGTVHAEVRARAADSTTAPNELLESPAAYRGGFEMGFPKTALVGHRNARDSRACDTGDS